MVGVKAQFLKLRRRAATVVAALPLTSLLLRKLALAPPRFKGGLVERVASALAARAFTNRADLVETNFGISSHLRVRVPAWKHDDLFGRPDLNPIERGTLALGLLCARDSEAFVDVGANEGAFTFLIAQAWGRDRHADIHSFEPDPNVHGRLASNLAADNIKVNVNAIALSDHVGTQTFNRNVDDDRSGSLTDTFRHKHRTEEIEVRVTTLAAYLVDRDIREACVKIDVEGAGVAVWDGLKAAKDRVRWLLFEIIGPEDKAGLVSRISAETGWHAYYICDWKLLHSSAVTGFVPPYLDWLFCADPPDRLAARFQSTRFEIVAFPATGAAA